MQPIAPKRWAWLFPLTYLLHLSEEFWGGEGFPSWVSRVAGAHFSNQDFLILNAVGLVMVTAGAMLIYKKSWHWLLIALSGIVLLNGLLHVVVSLLTRTYSPGAVTGLLCWIPLGTFLWWREWQQVERRIFWIGASLAFALHTIVSALALLG